MMGIKDKLAGALSLPTEVVLNLPVVIWTGRNEANIENYKGILEYSDTRVRVNTRAGLLVIEGTRLHLKQITAENITVTGDINSINYK
jgi:sporulation protein YqfC